MHLRYCHTYVTYKHYPRQNMGVLCYCLVTIKKLAVFRCKYNSRNATIICYVLFFKSKFYSSLFLIKRWYCKIKNIFEKTTFPKSIYFGLGIFLHLYHFAGVECVAVGKVWRIMTEKWRDMAEMRLCSQWFLAGGLIFVKLGVTNRFFL